jgi:hypothetical protein
MAIGTAKVDPMILMLKNVKFLSNYALNKAETDYR